MKSISRQLLVFQNFLLILIQTKVMSIIHLWKKQTCVRWQFV